ncbi:dienelactone hydrolase family protein [Actinomadura algeriensis]|uniref:Carboxymethylenebutenolidase n=1 Tax=Actinomadura algeriensis TaxID=1679523 RepID=A0ABR9JRS7_9ACTN|nr:dienelactone hydrolase family protein [Actinomadura algeriensis]MBE1533271.1 carboxymethylenebutenolidase [Actinomadura algeriensis]
MRRVVRVGGQFDLTVWGEGPGPGVLLVQEIFGVGEYMEAVAEDLVGLGYVVGAPDMFWRIEPNWAVKHDEQAVPRGMAMVSQFDWDAGVEDLGASLGTLERVPGVGPVGVLGFCFGGTLAYLLASRVELPAVSFYGSGVPAQLDLLAQVRGPLQLHFGGDDPYIPREDVAKVERAAGDGVEVHVQEDGGHAFHNRKAPMFYQEGPAERAWVVAVEFLRRHLQG